MPAQEIRRSDLALCFLVLHCPCLISPSRRRAGRNPGLSASVSDAERSDQCRAAAGWRNQGLWASVSDAVGPENSDEGVAISSQGSAKTGGRRCPPTLGQVRVTLRQLNRASLARQGLLERIDAPVPEAIGRLAGLQAQHANSPYIALWSRRRSHQIEHLELALEGAAVVKATLMRATIHLVAAPDFHVLDLATAEPRMAAWRPTAKKLGVDLTVLNQGLLDYCSEPRSVAEMEEHMADLLPAGFTDQLPAGVRNPAFRMSSAGGGLVHVPPSGLWKSHGRPSYIDARVWLGTSRELDPVDALSVAAERYLIGYGPASPGDFAKWVGERRVTRVREALERLGDRLVEKKGPEDRTLIDLTDLTVPHDDAAVSGRFLARWDSLLIGYDDRSRILPEEYRHAVIKKNGDFLPTFLVDGFVAGLWSLETKDDMVEMVLTPFADVPPRTRAILETEGEALARFIEPDGAGYGLRWTG